MAVFVVDASAALAWCIADETDRWTDGLLERLRQGDQIVVPAHWPTEILNGLLVIVVNCFLQLSIQTGATQRKQRA